VTRLEQSEIDALWAKEAEDRLEALEQGELRVISAAEVFSDIRPQIADA